MGWLVDGSDIKKRCLEKLTVVGVMIRRNPKVSRSDAKSQDPPLKILPRGPWAVGTCLLHTGIYLGMPGRDMAFLEE